MKKLVRYVAIFVFAIILFALFDSALSPDDSAKDASTTITQAVQTTSAPSTATATPTKKPTALFTMYSFDDFVDKHHVVGGIYEPSGYYEVICTQGHGHLSDANERGYMLAADEYIGTEYGSTTYAQSVTLYLKMSEVLRARNLHSTKFVLDFYYIGETLE